MSLDGLNNFLDLIVKLFKELEKVPAWRLIIAFIFLGAGVNKVLLKLKELR